MGVLDRLLLTYLCSQTEPAEEAAVLTPQRLYFLLITVRAAVSEAGEPRVWLKELETLGATAS